MEIGERIKNRREELGMTQLELAKKLGYDSKTTISKIESGKNELRQINIKKFAWALQVTTSYLMGWDEEEKERIYSEESAKLVAKLRHDPEMTDLLIRYYESDPKTQERIMTVMKLLLT